MIILIGCGAAKAVTKVPIPAQDLYTGCLFKARRRYAERRGYRWYIVSALHGLIAPHELLLPYDFTLAALKQPERASWGARVCAQIAERTALTHMPLAPGRPGFPLLELHMGEAYAAPIEAHKVYFNLLTNRPVRGLGQGQLLRYYKNHRA